MNVYDRIVAALEVAKGRIPDKVPNHFVSLRTKFMKIAEELLDIKEEDVVYEGGFGNRCRIAQVRARLDQLPIRSGSG
jgi:hypothetical protein